MVALLSGAWGHMVMWRVGGFQSTCSNQQETKIPGGNMKTRERKGKERRDKINENSNLSSGKGRERKVMRKVIRKTRP